MRKLFVASLPVALALTAGPLPADPPTATGETEKLVCKRIDTTGSRVSGKRVCRTAAQWQQEANEARRVTQDLQRLRHGPNGS